MVGMFSRFSGKNGLRRTQSALDQRQVTPPQNSEATRPNTTAAAAASHSIEVAIEFKPVEHPIEPLDNDKPIKCPLPEPSILDDLKLWKEQTPANTRKRADLPVKKEELSLESEASDRMTSSSINAPECNVIDLLEESDASVV